MLVFSKSQHKTNLRNFLETGRKFHPNQSGGSPTHPRYEERFLPGRSVVPRKHKTSEACFSISLSLRKCSPVFSPPSPGPAPLGPAILTGNSRFCYGKEELLTSGSFCLLFYKNLRQENPRIQPLGLGEEEEEQRHKLISQKVSCHICVCVYKLNSVMLFSFTKQPVSHDVYLLHSFLKNYIVFHSWLQYNFF